MSQKLYIPDLRAVADKRPAGYLEEILAAGRIENDVVLHIEMDVYRALVRKYSPKSAGVGPQAKIVGPHSRWAPGECRKHVGPGTELKKLLSKFGLTPAPNCKCKQRIAAMNQRGVQWCTENIETIVEWLEEEAKRKGYPFTRLCARILVKRAISNAKKKSI